MNKLFLTLIILLFPVFCFGASDVTFEWDLNTEQDMAGYRLYQSASPGIVPAPGLKVGQDIPHPTNTYTIAVEDGTWYWVVTAYDISGNESLPSNEVSDTLDTEAPAPPQNFFIQFIMKIVMWLKSLFGGFRAIT